MVIELNESVEWIKFNTDQVGYYRVNYERSEWNVIINVLERSHEVNRMLLLFHMESNE